MPTADAKPMTSNVKLLPLPEPEKEVYVANDHGPEYRDALEDYFTADQMRAYAQAALNARAGGDAKDAERWRALRTMTWRVHEIEPSEFDEHGDEAIAAALASQAVGVGS